MFNSVLTRPLILALLISLGFNGLFGYLSYKFYSDKAVAEEQLNVAVGANNALSESYDKKETACKIADSITAEYQEEKQELVGEKDQALRDIDALVDVPAEAKNTSNTVKKDVTKPIPDKGVTDAKDNIASLDDKLPDSLRLLLEKSYQRVRGSVDSHP